MTKHEIYLSRFLRFVLVSGVLTVLSSSWEIRMDAIVGVSAILALLPVAR